MIIPTLSEWTWEQTSTCVNSLEDSLRIDPSSHFLDKNWRHSLSPEFLVNTQEVDLSHFAFLLSGLHSDRDSGDEAKKLVLLSSSDSYKPIRELLRHHQRPSQKFLLVIEPEVGVFVLHVIVS